MSEKTSAELVDGFIWWMYESPDPAPIGERQMARRKLEDILDAHRREVEAEWKEEAGEAYASGYRDGVASVDVVAPPKHAGDPAKADTCANCGALAWQYRTTASESVENYTHNEDRFCEHCGRAENMRVLAMGETRRWHCYYPGKGAHTEGEER